ncbi:(2Fe-2S)-binding protein [Natranaerobius thermophilus]|uniref:(2Fe-2S)-binding protein n=1 Tax=Natranaerobius thermophilus TaxID=375929 RepID=UPI0001666FE4|nr:(2Fe-2S)-binding protein [Natranaerobius thermophilus]
MRIKNHPILNFENNETVTFYYEGQKYQGVKGETIASALHAAGVKVLRNSRRHKRPRGFFCAIGNCSSCSMKVNGVPNVRVCVEPLEEGMVVEKQDERGELNV